MTLARSGLRRGPWLSGLMVAVAGAVWMIGRVVADVMTMAVDFLQAAGGV